MLAVMSMASDSESRLAEEIETILTQVGLQELQYKFISEKVYVATVPLLTDEQLRQLGVARMGDRAALVQACKRMCLGSRVSQEVKRIMQPSFPATVTARNSDTGSSSATTRNAGSPSSGLVGARGYRIPVENRRLRRRQSSKLMSLGTGSVAPTLRQASFSKKLFVFRYMHGAPKSFTRKDKDIVARGFVNDICVNATEQEVRDEICAVLVNSELPQLVTPNAFEFIDVSGKLAFVPSIKEGFEFNGRIVKQLAGAGSLYIRLLQNLDASTVADPEEVIISDSDDDKGLPPLPFRLCRESNSNAAMSTRRGDDLIGDSVLAQLNDDYDLVSTPLEESTPIGASQSGVSMPREESTPIAASQSGDRPSSNANQCGDSNGELPGPSRVLNEVQQLQEAFSNLPPEFISTVYSIAKCDFVATVDCLIKGDLLSLLSLVKLSLIDSEADDAPSIHIPEEQDWAIAAFSFYKSSRFDSGRAINVILGQQPAIDAGGARCTFFSAVYEKVIMGYLDMFEGPHNRLRPTFKISVLNSGILKIFGKMIAHTLLMDGVGFPYLSPSCYYYMAGKWNIAVTFISDEDVSSRVRHILKQLREGGDINSLNGTDGTELIELLEQSGSDIALKEENKGKICQTLLVYDSLIKRKPFLDSFSEGLELFRIKSLMTSHPKMFEKKFVGCSSVITKKEVKDLIRTTAPHGSNPVQLELLNALGTFIDNSSEEDLRKFLLFSTGCQEALCNRIIIEFTNDELAPALAANTCSRVLTISLRISPTSRLIDGLKAVISGNDFTMVELAWDHHAIQN